VAGLSDNLTSSNRLPAWRAYRPEGRLSEQEAMFLSVTVAVDLHLLTGKAELQVNN